MGSKHAQPVLRTEIGRPRIDPTSKRLTISVTIGPEHVADIEALMAYCNTDNRSAAICYAIERAAKLCR